MSAALSFHRLFRHVLARQVEYSYGDAPDRFTSMVPLKADLLPQVIELAEVLPFAGEWAWAVGRFSDSVAPEAYLLRLDWWHDAATAVTLYCRFPSEPGTAEFRQALVFARPFRWDGPDPSAVATALGVEGPRGIAFRATHEGRLRTSLYFRSEQHAGAAWTERLTALLAASRYPGELAAKIEECLKHLYVPGPAGVIGVDDGEDGTAGALKFDPANVPLPRVLAFWARVGVSPARIAALRDVAVGLRAEAATYLGIQFGRTGIAGWRVYFACEPAAARAAGTSAVIVQRNLRPVRRLPHHGGVGSREETKRCYLDSLP
jgi:hypothetical protein